MDVPAVVESKIITIRGQKVILDRDLAELYGVSTGRLNEAVKRNSSRFPLDVAFLLTRQKLMAVISQNSISGPGHGGVRKLPRALTEHGAIMAANVLRSPKAIEMSVFALRAFVRMRKQFAATREPARRLTLSLAHRHYASSPLIPQYIIEIVRQSYHQRAAEGFKTNRKDSE